MFSGFEVAVDPQKLSLKNSASSAWYDQTKQLRAHEKQRDE